MAVAITRPNSADITGVAASGNVASYTNVNIGVATADRIIVVCIGTELTSSVPTACTIDTGGGAVAMTAAEAATQGAVNSHIFYLRVISGTTATIAVTFGATNPDQTQNHIAVYRVVGASLAAPFDTGQVADTDADPITSGALVINAGGAGIAICADATDTTARTWTGFTEDLDADAGTFRFSTGTLHGVSTPTITVSGGNNEDGALSWIIFDAETNSVGRAHGRSEPSVLLLHFEGADASTTITDSSPSVHTLTAVNQAQIDTAQFKFGSSAVLFDGTTDYILADGSEDFNFGKEDFTVDCWLRINVLQDSFIIDFRSIASSPQIAIQYASDGSILVRSPVGILVTSSAGAVTTGTWYHVAVTRAAGIIRIFLDGVSQGTPWNDGQTDYPNYADRPVIGATCEALGNNSINGWLDELRVLKGIAVWTSNFTAPAGPHLSTYNRWGQAGSQGIAAGTGTAAAESPAGPTEAAGSASGTGAATAAGAATIAADGSAAGTGTSSAVGTGINSADGAAAGSGAAAAAGEIIQVVEGVGSAAGTGTGSAIGAATAAADGAAAGSGAATATATAIAASDGAAAGTGTATGAAAATVPADGDASGTGTASAVGAATAASDGAAAGTGAASAVGTEVIPAAGDAAGTGAATAIGAATAEAAGAAAGSGAAVATATATAESVGSAAGTGAAAASSEEASLGNAAGSGTAAAVGIGINEAVGSAAGTGAAAASSAATAASTGDAAGTGTASAISEAVSQADGAASGTGAASATSTAIAASDGSAAGTGTAAAVGEAGTTTDAVGSASGTGAAAATSAITVGAAGTVAGTGDAAGTGAQTIEAAGTATGAGTAAGVSEIVGVQAGVGIATATSFVEANGAAIAAVVPYPQKYVFDDYGYRTRNRPRKYRRY